MEARRITTISTTITTPSLLAGLPIIVRETTTSLITESIVIPMNGNLACRYVLSLRSHLLLVYLLIP
jgi:hypothetical protein